MNTILNKLNELVNYYNVNRQVGHTFKMITGVLSDTKYTTPYNNEVYKSNVKSIILTHNTDMARNIKDRVDELSTDKQNIAYLSFNSGNYDQVLKGNHSPLLIDNCLLQQLFQEAATEIETLSTDVNRYKQDNITLNQFNKKLEAEKKEMAQVITKLKCELLDYQEDDVNKENIDLAVINKCPPNVAKVIIGTFEQPYKSIKSIDLKIEYKE